ncbi:MAG: GH3 auxin-responsive promoter family protein, partial [Promethearchaeota archaeon]
MSARKIALRIAYKRLCEPFLKKLENPVAAQEACLRKVLKRCRNTVYGKEHNFADIKSVEEFQNTVPITTYENMHPYISRCMKGEQNVLFPDRIVYFMATSGTTGDPKYFPLGEYRLRETTHESARKGLFYIVHGNHYNLMDGAIINLYAAPSIGVKFGSYDVAYVSGALAASFASQQQSIEGLGRLQSSFVIPPPEVNALSDWEKKAYLAARYAVAADIRMTVGISALIVSLLRKISTQFYEKLLTDPELDHQTKAKLRQVTKNGVINLRELWPNFTIFANSGISITPFRQVIHDLLGDVEIWSSYGATEGTLGGQIYPEGGIVAAVDRTFFEFQAMEEGAEPIPLSEVKINTPYKILITNHAGFYRYSLGDLVTFVALDPPE